MMTPSLELDHNGQVALANSPEASREVLESLTQSPFPEVVSLAQLHVNLVGEVTEGWHDMAISHLRQLNLNPKRKQVLELALGIIPESLLSVLDLDLRVAIAKQSETNPQLLAHLAEDYHEYVRKAIAANPSTPVAVLEKLVGDRALDVRLALTQNTATPASALIGLADDVYETVHKALLKNPRLPGEALYKLRELVPYNFEKFLVKVARDPKVSPEVLRKLAQEKDIQIRESVAAHPSTPLDTLEKLAKDPYECVCKKVAANPLTPIHILEDLASYGTVWVGEGLGSNPNTSTALLVKILESTPLYSSNNATQAKGWASAIENPNLPMDIAEAFVQNMPPIWDSGRVLDAIARRRQKLKQASIDIQELPSTEDLTSELEASDRPMAEVAQNLNISKFAQSSCAFSRLAAFFNPQMPKNILVMGSHSTDWWERYAIAQNPNTPVEPIQALSEDHNCLVRAAAKANLSESLGTSLPLPD